MLRQAETHTRRESAGNGRASAFRASPKSTERGTYFLGDVRTCILAADFADTDTRPDLPDEQLLEWASMGFYSIQGRDDLLLKHHFDEDVKFLDFRGLITARLIAILLSRGVTMREVVSLHQLIADETGADFPFATRTAWGLHAAPSCEMHGRIDRVFNGSSDSGSTRFSSLMSDVIAREGDLEFSDSGYALSWEPAPGVLIDPQVMSGAPCIKGRRIDTPRLFGWHQNGETVEDLCEDYELTADQVEAALNWERKRIPSGRGDGS